MRITAITCTFERPEAFALCQQYMAAQTRPPDQWLILDGPEPMIEKLHQAIMENRIEGDGIVFFEDDDAFMCTWIEWAEKQLEKGYDLIGEGLAIYYNVRQRWWSKCSNHSHASLCQTAIHRRMLPRLAQVIRTHRKPWIDTQLWKLECNKHLTLPKDGERRLIGIKGMPGKNGYSREHRKYDPTGCINDPSLRQLYKLIGPPAKNYLSFARR